MIEIERTFFELVTLAGGGLCCVLDCLHYGGFLTQKMVMHTMKCMMCGGSDLDCQQICF